MAEIRCSLQHLRERCEERAYDFNTAAACVIEMTENGENILVDTEHPAYPKKRPQPGPGEELKKLLAKIGIKATPNCSCNARANIMDARGVAWCKENESTIVGWLREEAEKRNLPFVDLAGKLLIRRAIALAEKTAKNQQQAKI
ncbi:hypothetical protein EBZ39_06265 [bacterium]|nr:hypothetical protein [bacterium]